MTTRASHVNETISMEFILFHSNCRQVSVPATAALLLALAPFGRAQTRSEHGSNRQDRSLHDVQLSETGELESTTVF